LLGFGAVLVSQARGLLCVLVSCGEMALLCFPHVLEAPRRTDVTEVVWLFLVFSEVPHCLWILSFSLGSMFQRSLFVLLMYRSCEVRHIRINGIFQEWRIGEQHASHQ